MRFTILTPSYQNLTGLRQVCAQLQAQAAESGCEVEHLVIDGGSTDGSAEWLAAAEPHVPAYQRRWISEKDHGLYDALNKGMRMATGEVMGILHTDDVWESGVLPRLAAVFAVEPGQLDAVYGDLRYVDANDLSRVRRVWKSGAYAPHKWIHGWMPPHTALFVRRESALRVGDYRLDLGSAADYEWMLRAALVHEFRMRYLPGFLVRMRVGGQSNASVKRRLSAHSHDREAWTLNHLHPRPWTLFLKPVRKIPQWLRGIISPAADPIRISTGARFTPES